MAQKKDEAVRWLVMAQAALDRGDISGAEQMVKKAEALGVPESLYGPRDPRPWQLSMEVASAKRRTTSGVAPAGFTKVAPAGGPLSASDSSAVQPGVYRPTADTSRTMPASAQASSQETTVPSEGERLYQAGLKALQEQKREQALALFKQAWRHEKDLDPATRQQLQDKLVMLDARSRPPAAAPGRPPSSTPGLEAIDARQQLLRQKLYREITAEQARAREMSRRDPKGAMTQLQKLRARVADAELDGASRKSLLTMVDREIAALGQFIEANRADIELNEKNQDVLRNLALDAERKQQIQNQLAKLVDEFNKLLDEGRYAEAEVIARQARQLDPEAPVVQNLVHMSRFARRMAEQMDIRERKEQGFYDTMTSVHRASEPFDDRRPIRFMEDAKEWADISKARIGRMGETEQRLSPAEVEIYKKLRSKVSVDFENRPLSEVLETLGQMAGIPITIDKLGIGQEGVSSDEPITLRVTQDVTLRSALNLILEPLRLDYLVEDEVLKVTSEQARSEKVITRTYDVADLVIPIPNFVPSYNTGLAGAIQAAHRAIGYNGLNQPIPLAISNEATEKELPGNASVLAQMGVPGAGSMANGSPDNPPAPGYTPAGMGGGVVADFSTLMTLIQETIDPDSWEENGGNGRMSPFPLSLSLVISNTEETHEKIAKLLQQLRRLQDVQITIEVRFITLQDDFFERIGIDFDFDIDDNVNQLMFNRNGPRPTAIFDDSGPSVVVGLDQQGITSDLDLPFRQHGFAQTVPQFGGIDPALVNSFGFAILSDIEMFFLLEAAEGDSRSNVLQAPKVTMFNGQSAFIQDQSFRPFVTSIEPVVADFAVAHRPVIVVLPEGMSLSVQAVASSDRRYVRLTLVPFFSRIGDVDEFVFDGEDSSDTGTVVIDDQGQDRGRNNVARASRGTRVQLPTFISTSISTTVNVPDGGTILLGGIKRLSEGRDERGVPMLDKMPYINRLFKNVGIGRTTQSLMMMVTPRIIIQEEEEYRQTRYRYEP